MAVSNVEKPATAATVNGLRDGADFGSQHRFHTTTTASLQTIRVTHLARRHALAPCMARVVADLVFEGGRAR